VPGGSAHVHPNGVTGISALGIVVSDLEESKQRYAALLGPDVALGATHDTPDRKETAFWLQDTLLVIAQPTDEGDPRKYLKKSGEGPYLLALGARPDIRPEVCDPALTHGVLLTVVSVPLKVGSVAEEYAYIAGLACSKCGGPYKVVRQSLDAPRHGTPMDVIEIICLNCGQSGSLYFDLSSFFNKQG
jgi:catechol 2,3-dioxygenase-like lactoylglutathione lyase family enzyme